MKILIAGLGSIGRRHFRNLLALGVRDLVLVRKNLSTLPDDELQGYPVESEIESAIQKHKPDGVVIANPTSQHLVSALPAIRAGLPVLLEKPISDSLDQVNEVRQAILANRAKVLVGFQFRYHPTIQKAREIIQQGGIGQILSAHAHWGEYLPNWHPWENYQESYAARKDLGGGVAVTLTHPIDYLRFILGEIAEVHAFHGHVSSLQLRNVEDVVEIGLRFANGAIGGAHMNYFQRPTSHHFEIIGSAGTLRWDNSDGILTYFAMPDPFGEINVNPTPAVTKTYLLPQGFERNDLFINQTRHFMDLVAGTADQPMCDFEDGVRALEVVLQAKKD